MEIAIITPTFRIVGESKFDFEIDIPHTNDRCISEEVKFSEIDGVWNVVMQRVLNNYGSNDYIRVILNIKSNIPIDLLGYTKAIKLEIAYGNGRLWSTPDYFLKRQLSIDSQIPIVKGEHSFSFGFKLTLKCNSNLLDMNSTCKQSTNSPIHKQTIANNISMLSDPTYSDFTFVVEGKEFKVHRNIVAAISPVMAKIFQSNMQESIINKCIVDNITSDTFNYMIRYIYGCSLPNEIGDIAIRLYEAAHYYDIKSLMDVCKEQIRFKLSAANAHETYVWALLYNMQDLRSEALKQLHIDEKNLSMEVILEMIKRKETELLMLKNLAGGLSKFKANQLHQSEI